MGRTCRWQQYTGYSNSTNVVIHSISTRKAFGPGGQVSFWGGGGGGGGVVGGGGGGGGGGLWLEKRLGTKMRLAGLPLSSVHLEWA